MPYDRPANPFHAENDSLILGTDAIPSPGFSRVRFYPPPSFFARAQLTACGSSGLARLKAILRSRPAYKELPSALRRSFKAPLSYMCYRTPYGCLSLVRRTIPAPQNANAKLTTDGTERQIIKDMEGNNQRPRIKYSSICDPFVFILREDDTIGLFIGEPERGKIRRKDMSPMGEKVGFILILCGH